MGKPRISEEEAERRRVQSGKDRTALAPKEKPAPPEIPTPASNPLGFIPKPSGKHETGLFIAIIGVLAVPLVFVLQANGVAEVGWLYSLLIYAGVLAVFIWAFLQWDEPCKWAATKRYSVLGIVSCLLAALSFCGVKKQYVRERSVQGRSVFSAEARSALVSDSGPLTFYMLGYDSMFGRTASPILYLIYIQMTNLQDLNSTISEFKVSASKESEGPWEDLVPIPLATSTLYSIGVPTPYPKVITMGRGTYRLATQPKAEDLGKAAIIRAAPLLERAISNTIAPHTAINGWIALDSLRRTGLTPGEIYLRITLLDTAHKGGRYISALPIRKPGEGLMDINNGVLEVTGILMDMSSFHIKYYGDRFPHR